VQLSKKEIEDLAKAGDIRAPFAGNICEILVEEGQDVEVGDRVIVLEAMKMQTPVASMVKGNVVEIFVELGNPVQAGAKLLKIVGDEE
jgi:pyruvate carboxylase